MADIQPTSSELWVTLHEDEKNGRMFVYFGANSEWRKIKCFLFIPDTVSFLLWGIQASQVIDCLVTGAGVVLVVAMSHYSVLISAL
mgnify:CR=1 FL=1